MRSEATLLPIRFELASVCGAMLTCAVLGIDGSALGSTGAAVDCRADRLIVLSICMVFDV